jgi:hypothetical protein
MNKMINNAQTYLYIVYQIKKIDEMHEILTFKGVFIEK